MCVLRLEIGQAGSGLSTCWHAHAQGEGVRLRLWAGQARWGQSTLQYIPRPGAGNGSDRGTLGTPPARLQLPLVNARTRIMGSQGWAWLQHPSAQAGLGHSTRQFAREPGLGMGQAGLGHSTLSPHSSDQEALAILGPE